MRHLLLFTIALVVFGCNQSNDTSESQQPITEETTDNTELIKEINNRLHEAFANEAVSRQTNDQSYIFSLKRGSELEFYFELGYDSEGWPMEGGVYYFNNNKLIGYGYIHCDGCIGQDISSRLKSLQIKQYKTAEDLKEWDVIWSVSNLDDELRKKESQILSSSNKSESNLSYGEIRGRIIGGNLRMLKRELGNPSYTDAATTFIENTLNSSLPIGLFDLCLNYEVYVYEGYLGNGQNLLVIVSNGKVTNVLPQDDVQDVRDVCCCK